MAVYEKKIIKFNQNFPKITEKNFSCTTMFWLCVHYPDIGNANIKCAL